MAEIINNSSKKKKKINYLFFEKFPKIIKQQTENCFKCLHNCANKLPLATKSNQNKVYLIYQKKDDLKIKTIFAIILKKKKTKCVYLYIKQSLDLFV